MNTSYLANAFHAGPSSRTLTGNLIVSSDRLRFVSEAGSVELPLSELQIRVGGNNAEQIFFEHPQHPDWSIYTGDFRIAEDAVLKSFPSIAAQLHTLRKRPGLGKPLAFATGVVLLLIGSLIALFLAKKDAWVRFLASKVPVAWEVNLGNSLFEQIKREGKIVTDAPLKARLQAVTARLFPVVADAGYVFQFHLLDDTNVNAFALPGGNIVVHTGLLKTAETPEEIAGVLAHEIAHVTERHGFRKIIEAAGLSLMLRSLVGDASGLTGVITESSEFLLRQKYSRDFEREADDVGWQYLVAANFDPRGLIDFFKRLRAQETDPTTVPAWLSTHPATEERIQWLEAKWERMERPIGAR